MGKCKAVFLVSARDVLPNHRLSKGLIRPVLVLLYGITVLKAISKKLHINARVITLSIHEKFRGKINRG